MAVAVNYITEDDAYEKVQSLWFIYLKIAVIRYFPPHKSLH
ncbi:hypothetical protein [Nostoc sp. ChiQUE01b]|nr:hypothetical protein [Nostoc sp. ChiQUE01b]